MFDQHIVDSSDVLRDEQEQRAAKLREQLAELERNKGPVASALASVETVAKVAKEAGADKPVREALAHLKTAFEALGMSVNAGPDALAEGHTAYLGANPEHAEDFRRERADTFLKDAHAKATEDAKLVQDVVLATHSQLTAATIPEPELPAADRALVQGELDRMLASAEPDTLTVRMAALVDELGFDSPYTRELAGSYGRSVAFARGVPDAHNAFRGLLAEKAAEIGTGTYKAAGQALQALRAARLDGWAGEAPRALVTATFAQLPDRLRRVLSL